MEFKTYKLDIREEGKNVNSGSLQRIKNHCQHNKSRTVQFMNRNECLPKFIFITTYLLLELVLLWHVTDAPLVATECCIFTLGEHNLGFCGSFSTPAPFGVLCIWAYMMVRKVGGVGVPQRGWGCTLPRSNSINEPTVIAKYFTLM